MGFLSNLLHKGETVLRSYAGDKEFLKAAAAAAANVVAADGTIEDAEISAAIKGMMDNPVIKPSYSGSEIEEALNVALNLSKTRAGRIQNARTIEHARTRDLEHRQDILLIAADVTEGNSNGLGDPEKKVLGEIAQGLGIDNWQKLAGL